MLLKVGTDYKESTAVFFVSNHNLGKIGISQHGCVKKKNKIMKLWTAYILNLSQRITHFSIHKEATRN